MQLPPESGVKLTEELVDAAAEADLAWEAVLNGEEEPIDTSGRAAAPRRRPGASITPDDGDDDPEHPTGGSRSRGLHVQRVITSHMDKGLREALRQQFEDEDNRPAVRRLDELADENVCHSRLWQLSKPQA